MFNFCNYFQLSMSKLNLKQPFSPSLSLSLSLSLFLSSPLLLDVNLIWDENSNYVLSKIKFLFYCKKYIEDLFANILGGYRRTASGIRSWVSSTTGSLPFSPLNLCSKCLIWACSCTLAPTSEIFGM